MANCRVSYRDIEGIRHAVEVQADSLFEAVAEAVCRFRSGEKDGMVAGAPPGPGCEFVVEMLPEKPVSYTVSLSKVVAHASHGTVKGPRDILRRQRLRSLLGLDASE